MHIRGSNPQHNTRRKPSQLDTCPFALNIIRSYFYIIYGSGQPTLTRSVHAATDYEASQSGLLAED
jgi:hypothetical protein